MPFASAGCSADSMNIWRSVLRSEISASRTVLDEKDVEMALMRDSIELRDQLMQQQRGAHYDEVVQVLPVG